MIPYLTTFDFYPHGLTVPRIRSRTICGNIKAGREESINQRIDSMIASGEDRLGFFFNPTVTLVPVPRSSPVAGTSIWPALVICRILMERGLCRDVATLIERIIPLRKASLQPNADMRPSVTEHYESMGVNRSLLPFEQFTLVDDVLTQGRTTYACFKRLQEVYPGIEVRSFAMARTRSFVTEPITEIFTLTYGQISYNPNTDKTTTYP